jgi:hypothetical protein
VHSEYHANGSTDPVLLSPVLRPAPTEPTTGPITSRVAVRLTEQSRDGRFGAWIERMIGGCREPGSSGAINRTSHRACTPRPHDRLARHAERLTVANADISATPLMTSSRGPTRTAGQTHIAADGTDVVAARAFDREFP